MPRQHQHPSQSHHQTERARQLRRDSTIPERLLWGLLRNRTLFGAKFRRQFPIGPFVADYYCHETRTVVELDGMSHVGRGAQDDARTAYLRSEGYTVIRVTNDDVIADRYAVAEWIARQMGVDDRRVLESKGSKSPHPNPLPEGEGAGARSAGSRS